MTGDMFPGLEQQGKSHMKNNVLYQVLPLLWEFDNVQSLSHYHDFSLCF